MPMISTSDARQWIPPSVCAVVSKRSSPESGAPCGPPRRSGPTSVRTASHHSVPRTGCRSVRAERSVRSFVAVWLLDLQLRALVPCGLLVHLHTSDRIKRYSTAIYILLPFTLVILQCIKCSLLLIV